MKPPNFNRIAKPYRWLEYLALGPLLQRTRTRHLPLLARSRRALLLGDGDGRFTAALLTSNSALTAEAVDLSPAMLALLARNSAPHASRLQTHCTNALTHTPTTPPDLIVTHFFLDCLTQPELNTLITRLAPNLPPGGLWLLSDFRTPNPLARLYVRSLYFAFRLLTGLRVTALPDYATPLRNAGLHPIAVHRRLFGLLTTELWQRNPSPDSH